MLSALALTLLFTGYTQAAADYCLTAPFGYGKNATGGGNATPTQVGTESELEAALKKKAKVILLTKDITVSNHLSISQSNLTILALPGVKLISNQQNKDKSGIFYIKDCSNLILRNLTFVGPGAYDCDGWDLLCFDGVTNAWVDHCDFQDGCDGNFDNKGKTDNITVTWCRFRYQKPPKAGGSGGTDDHRFSNLLGSSSSDKPSDGTYNMTWAYCWWDEGCAERMLRCRNASLHFLNCYWNSADAHYYIGPENADCYIEGCSFAGAPTKDKIFYQNYNGKNGAKFVNCISKSGVPANVTDRTVQTPSYAYTTLAAGDAQTAVTHATCGAGATLQVNAQGEVSSACSGGSGVDPNPDPTPAGELTYNFSDAEFAGLGEITSTVTVKGITIAAESSSAVTLETGRNQAYGEDYTFTARLKLGGTMKANARHVSFNVSGPCTIEVYGMSSNSTNPRTVNLAQGTWNTTIHQWENVTGSEINKLTYTYTGGNTTLYIGSASSGVNLYGINVRYNSTTSTEEIILRPTSGKIYNILGQEVDEHYKGFVIRDGRKYLQQ